MKNWIDIISSTVIQHHWALIGLVLWNIILTVLLIVHIVCVHQKIK